MLDKTAVAVRNGNVELAAHVIRKEGERCNMLYGQLSKFHLEAMLKNGQKVKAPVCKNIPVRFREWLAQILHHSAILGWAADFFGVILETWQDCFYSTQLKDED